MNNKIYAIAGNYEEWEMHWLTPTTEEYNPATDTWTERGNIRTSRSALAAVAVTGKIYAIGGFSVNGNAVRTNEEYTPGMLFYIHKQN